MPQCRAQVGSIRLAEKLEKAYGGNARTLASGWPLRIATLNG